jgi:hypothetical protein
MQNNELQIAGDNIPSEITTTQNSKFDYKTTTKPQSKNKLIIIATLSILTLIITAITLYSSSLIAIPELMPILENNVSNDEVIFTSKNKPFFVNYNGSNKQAQKKDSVYTVNLGKVEGKVTYNIGGLLDLGPHQILGSNTKAVNLERDYSAPLAQAVAPKFVDSKIVNFTISLVKEEDVEIKNGDKSIYKVNGKDNLCTIDLLNKKNYNCKLDLGDAKEATLKLNIADALGNSKIFNESVVKVVEANNFDCNKDVIADTGKLTCKGNKDAKVTYKDKEVEYKANTDLILDDLPNGPHKIAIKLTDIHEMQKTIEFETNIDKDKLSINMWSNKFSKIDEFGTTRASKNVFAKLNKDANVTVSFNENITFVTFGNKTFQRTRETDQIKMKQSFIPANSNVNFLDFFADNYEKGWGVVNNKSTFNLEFTATNGRKLIFLCDKSFMCDQKN